MAMTPRLEVRQSQSLTLTPQLMQSIRLLQLSHLELNAFVEMELMRNPLLEREDGIEASDTTPEGPEIAAGLNAAEDTVAYGDRIQSADSIAEGYDTEIENVFPSQSAAERQTDSLEWSARNGSGEEAPDIDQYVAARPTLSQHLAAQTGLILADPGERLIAQFLIDSLNEAGYLTVDLDTVARMLGTEIATVESVLQRIQGCDPVGVFARDVGECLALQLKDRNRLDPLMQALLDNLELIAQHDLPLLARTIGADREDLMDMLAELRQLDPKPGRAFETAPVEAVAPDVFVKESADGWQVELNSEVLPRVLVNRVYYAAVTRKARNATEKTFLVDSLATANWLAKSLDQRAQTILKVAAEIVKQQDGFLREGIARLKPMTLKTVADAIEMHESTVSRVTSNKYIATPRGLFEMKYFFTTALGSATGGIDHSAESVRHRIRQIIEAEKPGEILSDDTIAEMLNAEKGIEVARRTVAKYREALNIPSSVIRRRQKRALVGAR